MADKKKEYRITEVGTGRVIHNGPDRRSVLPNDADFKIQLIIGISAALLTACLAVVGYCGDVAYKGILTSITDLKSSNDSALQKIWMKVSNDSKDGQNKFDWVLQQCCQNAKTPPPPSAE